jgi:phospholipid/cholesterol/gamma-HCH transport system substrate-binding protein
MAFFRRSSDPDAPRIPRKDRRGIHPAIAGGLVLLAAAVIVYFAFAKKVPFTHGFRVEAVFQNANSIRPNSPVRIAGVDVGKVTKVARYKDTDMSVVTFDLKDKALPIHKDATAKIRPRIFLEGNFFVDLQPGTPSSPTIDDGDTLPYSQTAAPVQFGDVLTALQQDTRKSLQQVLQDYGSALTSKPTAADDANGDPDTRGQSAAQSLNDTFDTAGEAEKNVSIVNQALLGVEPDDLSRLIASLATVTGSLGRNEGVLQDFVTNFNGTMKIFADESDNLQATIRQLSPTLDVTDRTLASLNRAFPPTRAFAREILPGVKETPATVAASFPWIKQTRALLQPSELQGVARELSPATADLAKTIDGTNQLLPQTDLVSKCVSRVILPTGDIVIQDGPLTTGKENYKEFWYAMVGLASEGQNFDGNGMYVRFEPGAGSQTISTGKSTLSGETLFGRAATAPLGTRPAYPAQRPPYRPDVPCYTQKIPDLNGAATGKGETSQTTPGTTIGNATQLIDTAVGPLQPVLNALVTDLTGLADQVLNQGTTGQIVNTVTGALGQITGGVPTGSSTKLQSGGKTTSTAKKKQAKAKARARSVQTGSDDVAGQLLNRLNPFRSVGAGG